MTKIYSNEEKEEISKIIVNELNQPLYNKSENKINRILPNITKIHYNNYEKAQAIYVYLENELCYQRTKYILQYYYEKFGIDYILFNTWVDVKLNNLNKEDEFCEDKKRMYESIKYEYSKKTF